jgi:hypothetical protein
MNDAIFLCASEKNLNEEIIKRICELSNSNVYLSLFNDSSVNKANIQFEMADFNKILNKLQKSENDMKEYKIVPKGFKTQLGAEHGKQEALENNVDFQTKKLASFDGLQYERAKYAHLLNSLETLKVASEYDAKNAFDQIFSDSKSLVAQGDSIADMAKIAMRHLKDQKLDMMKIATVYDMISSELKNGGYAVNEELTKMSSLAINEKSTLLEPIMEYSLGISKIASFAEMCTKVESIVKAYDAEIEKQAGILNSIKSKAKSVFEYAKNNKKQLAQQAGMTLASDLVVGVPAGMIGAKIMHNKQVKSDQNK